MSAVEVDEVQSVVVGGDDAGRGYLYQKARPRRGDAPGFVPATPPTPPDQSPNHARPSHTKGVKGVKKRFFSDESAQNTRNKYIHAATEAPLLGRPAALGARVGGAAPHPGPRHRHQRFGRRGALLLGRGASFECRDAGAAEEIHVPMGVPQAACTWMHFAFECEAPEMVLEQHQTKDH